MAVNPNSNKTAPIWHPYDENSENWAFLARFINTSVKQSTKKEGAQTKKNNANPSECELHNCDSNIVAQLQHD